jgi:hypothetical protein
MKIDLGESYEPIEATSPEKASKEKHYPCLYLNVGDYKSLSKLVGKDFSASITGSIKGFRQNGKKYSVDVEVKTIDFDEGKKDVGDIVSDAMKNIDEKEK